MTPRTPTPILGLLVALGLLAGCASAPPVVERTPLGLIRGHDATAAEAYRDDFVEFHAAIRALLPDTRDGRVDLWVGALEHAHHGAAETAWADAFTLTWSDGRTPRVHLPDAVENDAERRNLIAHELVHALLGPSWRTLPTALEEGLATWVATRLEPRSYQRITKLLAAGPDRLARVEYSAHVAGRPLHLPERRVTLAIASASDTSLEQLLAYPQDGRLYPDDRAEKLRLYGVGLALVETIVEREGLEGLHALAERAAAEGHARIPAAWILAAADADTPEGRARALRPPLRPEDALWLLDQHQLWRHLSRLYKSLGRAGAVYATDPRDFVDSVEVRLSVGGGGSVSWRELAMFDQLRDELLRAIDRSPETETVLVAARGD